RSALSGGWRTRRGLARRSNVRLAEGTVHLYWSAASASKQNELGNEKDGSSRRQTRRKIAIGVSLTRNIAIFITMPRIRSDWRRVAAATSPVRLAIPLCLSQDHRDVSPFVAFSTRSPEAQPK